MSRGVMIFAHDQEQLELAQECSRRVHKYLGLEVCLVTNLRIFHHSDPRFEYVRSYELVTAYSKHFGYEMSPFDETLILDPTYMIMNPKTPLNLLFAEGSSEFKIGMKVQDLMGNVIDDDIHPNSIKNVSSAVIYFKKSPLAEKIFLLSGAVSENWNFFSKQFRVKERTNDALFAIAFHLVMGQVNPTFREVYRIPFPILMLRDVERDKIKALDEDQAYIVYDAVDCKRAIVLHQTDFLSSEPENLLNMLRQYNQRETA